MNKKVYALKDGSTEVYDVRAMDADELQAAQEQADFASHGEFGWVEVDIKYGRSKQLLKDLHEALFDIVHNPARIPCDCPPALPIYDERGNIIAAEPAFSCCYCRLSITVDEIYEEEARDAVKA